MIKEIQVEFDFGEVVYLIAAAGNDELLMAGQVVNYTIYPGEIKYTVHWADGTQSYLYDFQLTRNKYLPPQEDHSLN